MHTKIKICGITRVKDALTVADAGADALGLNFAPISPRRVAPEAAREISEAVAGRLLRVGLFVDASEAEVRKVLSTVRLDVLQFHGDEPGEFCRRFELPYMKVFRVRGAFDLSAARAAYADACALMLDAYVAGVPGGTGQRVDVDHWPDGAEGLVLAGGLTPANVADVVRRLMPYGVDVSGGVEAGEKGVKDADKIEQFVREVRSAGR